MSASNEPLLPKGFEDLAPYVDWALPHLAERGAKRMASTMTQCKAFYDALTPRMEALIGHLEGYPREVELDAATNRLFMLGKAYMDAAIPVDSGWKSTINEGSFPASRIDLVECP